MTTAGTSELVHTLRHGDVTRRDFIARGIGAGMSLGAIGAALRAHGASAAQDAERSRTVIFDITRGVRNRPRCGTRSCPASGETRGTTRH